MNENNFSKFLESKEVFNWTYWCVGTTKYELSTKSARRLMSRYYNLLNSKVNGLASSRGQVSVKMFWMTEPNDLRDGCHVHFMLECDVSIDKKWLNDTWRRAAGIKKGNHRATFEKYDYGLGGSDYCTKYINRAGADYDIFFNGTC